MFISLLFFAFRAIRQLGLQEGKQIWRENLENLEIFLCELNCIDYGRLIMHFISLMVLTWCMRSIALENVYDFSMLIIAILVILMLVYSWPSMRDK